MYETVLLYLTVGFAAVFLLVALTNIIAQVLKKIVDRNSFPTQAIVFVIAEVLTCLTIGIGLTILNIPILWYYWVAAIVLGFIVTYGAIFGYDNLYDYLFTAVKNLINAIFKKE